MHFLSQKIKAGALQFAILISVVIAIIVSAFILLTHTQLKFTKQIELSGQTIKLSTKGINHTRYHTVPYTDSVSLSFNNSGLEEFVTIEKTHWGLFDKISSKGQSKGFSYEKTALIGGSLDSLERPALYLDNTNAPLVVVGNTRVKGTAILPRQGVKAGNIAGDFYKGERLIYGNISETSSSKPAISKEKGNYLRELLFGVNIPKEADRLILNAQELMHTFKEDPKWVYQAGVIELQNHSLTNNIIIKSDTLIRVSAFTKAKNVLLIAPQIIIEENANGTFQAIASKSIVVEENTHLNYPSSLVLVNDTKISNQNTRANIGIVIREKAIIEGSIVHLSEDENVANIKSPKIAIEEGALVKGEVYSDEWLELFGTVYGSVYAHQLAARVRGSIYKNHLFNAVIDASRFPSEYSGILTDKSSKTVLQWMD